jgi:2-polyprenyl-3-methyl-5-hydroxy-6-metoxy-1,4-benzoquinol methylase
LDRAIIGAIMISLSRTFPWFAMHYKLRYFLLSARKRLLRQGRSCPACGGSHFQQVSIKYLVTTLVRCSACQLLFRAPTTTEEENEVFYHFFFNDTATTEMPTLEKLAALKQNKFIGSPKDFSARIRILDVLGLGRGATILDFGSSWGYGSWQFAEHGFSVQAYEISRPRADYARTHLDVDVVSDAADLKGSVDVFFSCHVLEHVPSVEESIALGFSLLRPGGYFVAFTPNGSTACRAANPGSWQNAWGMKHPNYLDEVFYKKAFGSRPYYLASHPYDLDELAAWIRNTGQQVGDMSGRELLAIAQKES